MRNQSKRYKHFILRPHFEPNSRSNACTFISCYHKAYGKNVTVAKACEGKTKTFNSSKRIWKVFLWRSQGKKLIFSADRSWITNAQYNVLSSSTNKNIVLTYCMQSLHRLIIYPYILMVLVSFTLALPAIPLSWRKGVYR